MKVMKKIPFSHPHWFYNLNIFDNNLFAIGGEPLRRHDFPLLWCKGVCQVGDFFKVEVEPPKLLTREELNAKFNLHLDFLSFHRVKNCISGVINMNKETLFHPNVSDASLPRLPVINKLSCIQEKGCREFYKTLLSKESYVRITEESESKWSASLGINISISGWDKIFRLVGNRLISNKIRWVQIQINHFKLPTNYTVSRYKASQSPWCSFCSNNSHYEYLPSLF